MLQLISWCISNWLSTQSLFSFDFSFAIGLCLSNAKKCIKFLTNFERFFRLNIPAKWKVPLANSLTISKWFNDDCFNKRWQNWIALELSNKFLQFNQISSEFLANRGYWFFHKSQTSTMKRESLVGYFVWQSFKRAFAHSPQASMETHQLCMHCALTVQCAIKLNWMEEMQIGVYFDCKWPKTNWNHLFSTGDQCSR